MYMFTEKQKIRLERVRKCFHGSKITNVEAVRYLQSAFHLYGTAQVIFHYHILGWR